MPLFLIGGTGFIGRAVTERLVATGHAVTGFHRGRTMPNLPDAVTVRHGDRNDPDALRDALDAAALDTRRIRTELGVAEPISHKQALVRSVLGEREA